MFKKTLGLTYADVLLVPKRSPLSSRSEADTRSLFTKNISLSTPFVSANMASVTESSMAIAMAREGGLGVIHQFMSIADQAAQIKQVKRSTSYIVENPHTIAANETLESALAIMHKHQVTSLLVIHAGQLTGILTSRDYQFETDTQKPVAAMMTGREKLIWAPPHISMQEAKQILHEHRIEKLPLLEGTTIKGLITTQDIRTLEQWPQATRDDKGRLRVAGAVGVKDALERSEALISAGADVIVLDIAHAHSDAFIAQLQALKQAFPHIDVMAGNIATAQAAKDLIEAGADGLKVGIGPSPVCTTRIISGAGIPQLTAIMSVCHVAKQYGIPVTADGGIKYSGDIAKAIAAGASSIYAGSLFAGTDESPGPILIKDGKRFKKYYGSASYENTHNRKEQERNTSIKHRLTDVYVEGVSSLVDYAGPVGGVINGLKRGLQSGISYCGAQNIAQMQQQAEFVRITSSGWHESGSRGNKTSE